MRAWRFDHLGSTNLDLPSRALYDRAMKKTKSKSSLKGKSKHSPTTVDEYLATVKGPAREVLTKMRASIRSAVPGDSTEVISYRIPAFKHKKIVVWYAAFANHCSLFPGGAVIHQMKDELDGFATSKGTIQFPIDKPLPTALIKKIVKRRLEQLD